ncbi:melanocortin receptor 4-like [Orbicella faveolata]|uniref:melanocortin receptor 4-like n=1 Tax=Orbicella faveolata TaxID=48498 RepID=UPI0009E20A79|nr:melanocortin receptor 4-like [Orbicella faveolata]
MANITGDTNFTSKLNQALSSAPTGMRELFSALNIFLSITASLGNVAILIALHKVTSIHLPTKLFFRCLAVTDLCVGLIVQPLSLTLIMSPLIRMNVQGFFYIRRVRNFLGWILCGVSILTSAAISVDRLLALLLGLRYRHVVTLRRVRVTIICFWLIGALAGWTRVQRAYKGTFAILTLSLVATIFCYTTIHLKLRHQQAQLHNNVPQGPIAIGGGTPLNIARYKRSLSSILSVQLALVVCYAPFGIALMLSANRINFVAWRATETLVYLNSSLNPVLYCWKIREVKQAAGDTIRQLSCF